MGLNMNNTFYKKHRGYAYGIAYSLCHNKDIAEDIAQDSLVRLIKYKTYNNTKSINIKTYIYKIVLNNYISLYNTNRLLYNDYYNSNETAKPETVLNPTVRRDDWQLKKAIKSLDETDQKIIRMAELEGYTHKEISNY